MYIRSWEVRVGLAVIVLMSAGVPGWAQNYPSKTVRIVVPFTPGGGVDQTGRTIAQKLTEAWGKPVLVDNRPGVGGNVGSDFVAKAPADGYTLLMGANTLLVNPSLYGNLSFDPLRDLTPITLATVAPNVLVAAPTLPANSVKELIALAQARPGALNYASGGNGVIGHLVGELLKNVARIEITHIPYKGNPEALNDVIGGRVEFMFSAPAAVINQIRAGKVKALAITSAARYPALSEVPTFAESGYPGVDASSWAGVLAPAGTPKDVIATLNREIVRGLTSPDTKARLAATGYDVVTSTPEQFGEMLRVDFIKWTKVVKEAGLHVD